MKCRYKTLPHSAISNEFIYKQYENDTLKELSCTSFEYIYIKYKNAALLNIQLCTNILRVAIFAIIIYIPHININVCYRFEVIS